jgi:hypothetical protein
VDFKEKSASQTEMPQATEAVDDSSFTGDPAGSLFAVRDGEYAWRHVMALHSGRRIVRKSTMKALAVLFALYAIVWSILIADITPVWLTEELRMFEVIILPVSIGALLLVAYFDWRAQLRRRLRTELEAYRKAS